MQLNPCKITHNKLEYGANFCGYIINILSNHFQYTSKIELNKKQKFFTNSQSINLYYGMMRHINCYNLRKSITKEII